MEQRYAFGLAGLLAGLVAGFFLFGSPSPQTGMHMMRQANIDAHFIEQMIPHHEGAIAMAQVALERSERPEIASLAQGIIDAQTKEIDDMKAWYEEWYGGAPAAAGHGMHMDGMTGDLGALGAAPDFDLEFIAQMIAHHEMAVMMAQMLAAGTARPEMKALADQIITSQSREITMMRSWAKQWAQ